jgi:hypothetical protein
VQEIVLSDSVIVQYGQGDQQLITISARSHVIKENLLSMKLESEEIEDMGSALRRPGMVRGLATFPGSGLRSRYPFAGHAIHLRGLAKVSLNALPRFSSTFEYDTKRCVE